jgi:hypothetical protein
MSSNILSQLHSCTPSTMQPCNFDAEKCNSSSNSNATPSLQTLAAEVLERNRLRNSNATSQKEACNFHATDTETQDELHSCTVLGAQPCNFSPKAAPSLNLNVTFAPRKLHGYATNEIEELKAFLGEDFGLHPDNPKALKIAAELLHDKKLIDDGIAPPRFTASTYCKSCDRVVPVPPSLVCGGEVQACMWCLNRVKGLPIPPITTKGEVLPINSIAKVTCSECRHFKLDTIGGGSGLGECLVIQNPIIHPLPYPYALRECTKFEVKTTNKNS